MHRNRRAARLGLTMHIDRNPWTATEVDLLERLVGSVSTARIARRLGRPENSVVTKLKRLGTVSARSKRLHDARAGNLPG